MAPVRGLTLACMAACALACGDTLVDGTYSGPPVFTVRGLVNSLSQSAPSLRMQVTIAMFWSPGGPLVDDYEEFVEQLGTSTSAQVPRPYVLNLFDEPGPQHLHTTSTGARYAIGRVLAYLDENRNGRRDSNEQTVGRSQAYGLIYAREALAAADSPTGRPLPAGWHIVLLPLTCSGPGPAPVADGECDVPVGAPCSQDSQCGAGVCVTELIVPWQGRACAIPEPPPNGCRQRGTVLVRDPRTPTAAYWLPGCESSADCKTGPLPYCNQRDKACMPGSSVQVELDDQPLRTFCLMGSQPPTP